MKRLLPVLATVCTLVAALTFSSSPASAAGGINLSWTDCGASGAADRTFSCLNNTGSNVLVGSYVTPSPLDSLNGNEIVMDIITSADPLPDWWKMGSGITFCRAVTAQSSSFDFTGSWVNCIDIWAGQALGGFGYEINPVHPGGGGAPFTNQSRRARWKIVCAIASVNAVPADSALELYSFRMTINNTKTVGTGLCAGCLTPGCIVLNQIRITENQFSRYGAFIMTNAPPGGRRMVTWQGGAGADCNLVPTKNRTWGQVKSLYR